MGKKPFSRLVKDLLALAAFLFVAFFPGKASAGQLNISSVGFFESGNREYSRDVKDPSIPVPLAPVTDKVFVQGLTRHIYCQVSFWNPLFNIRDQNVRLSLRGYMSDGSFLGEISEDLTVKSDSNAHFFTKRLPWQEPGQWAVGTYTVEVHLDGVYVGKGNFDISSSLDSLHMKFFESDRDIPSKGNRTYATSFAQNTARSIYCEVSYSSCYDCTTGRTLKLSLKYYKPDGSLMGVPSLDYKSYESYDSFYLGWGWQEPGHWTSGTYTVEAYLDGGYIGKSTFDIYGSSSASEDPFEIGKKLALAGRYEEQLKIWVKDNWAGDGDTYSLHIEYDQNRDSVVFCERPLSGKGVEIFWVKSCRDREYVKLLGETAGNTLTDTIPITREQAEREAWRILKYFNY
jgi:hypothetical protein